MSLKIPRQARDDNELPDAFVFFKHFCSCTRAKDSFRIEFQHICGRRLILFFFHRIYCPPHFGKTLNYSAEWGDWRSFLLSSQRHIKLNFHKIRSFLMKTVVYLQFLSLRVQPLSTQEVHMDRRMRIFVLRGYNFCHIG